jgi:hypothetical protein
MMMTIHNVSHIAALISESLSPAVSGTNPARDALITEADRWFRWLIGSTVLVAIGCAMEIWEASVEVLQWTWQRRDKPFQEDGKRLSILMSVIGLVFVIVGVALEGYFEARQAASETAIREYDEKALAAATREAGSAKASAEAAAIAASVAQFSVYAVEARTDAINTRLDEASAKVGTIEHTVRLQGPRWKIIEARSPEFVRRLKPFAGQKVLAMYCGHWPEEAARTADLLTRFLRNVDEKPPGAGWLIDIKTWGMCQQGSSFGPGIFVVTSTAANSRVQDAAKALAETLTRMDIFALSMPVDPQRLEVFKMSGPDSPWENAIKDPSLVVVVVGDNPVMDSPKALAKKNPPMPQRK